MIILPVTFYVWSPGWLISGRCTPKDVLRVRFAPDIQVEVFGPAHLWFLEYLFLMSLTDWLFARRGRAMRRRAGGASWSASHLR